ncbi:hypothetical protein AB0O01_34875 [Streptomyces sp. NPDC093252]|uniref:hypothetical protein n=1 Tax=Streptomyces sp. NPDC093252 TaxID=3154980 RepID=UPI003438C17D
MTRVRPRLLYVTDLAYEARGRRYGDEDVLLADRLRADADLALCNPRDAAALMDAFDAVIVRNSGPVFSYRAEYEVFRERARETGARVYNPLTGRADMAGKGYLPELSAAGFPVVPTVVRAADLGLLPAADRYVVKPVLGADSIGLRVIGPGELPAAADGTVLVQPYIDFAYEVSFYFVDHDFQYALYAPDPGRRWRLEPYEPTPDDLDFARRFIRWNTLDHGIQRVDACRAPDGSLLLVELEDLNPYLSLDALPAERREAFVAALRASLRGFVTA